MKDWCRENPLLVFSMFMMTLCVLAALLDKVTS